MNGIDKIHQIMIDVRELSYSDFAEMQDVIDLQTKAVSPLSNKKAREIRRIAKHNQLMFDQLVKLREVADDWEVK